MSRKQLEARAAVPVRQLGQFVGVDVQKRAVRALSLVRQGELSSARMVLEGAEVTPGNLATLRELRRDLQGPDLSQEVLHNEPAALFELDQVEFLVCLRTARRGQQVGPLASQLITSSLCWSLNTIRDCFVKQLQHWHGGKFLRRFCQGSGWADSLL